MYTPVKVCGLEIRIEGRLLRIARLEGEKYEFLQRPEPVVEALRRCRNRIDLFTFMQALTQTAPAFPYPMEWDNLAALPVTTFADWWSKQIGNKTRNMVRQAGKKGVVVRELEFDETLVEGIWEIYNECPVRQGRLFAHYGEGIEEVYKEEATFLDSSIFAGAFFEGRLIGFIKLVHDQTRTQAGLMNVLSMISHRDKAPTNALIAQAVRSCADRGIRYLVYSNFAYGKRQHSSISDFKKHNGFMRVDVPRYYVPLTSLGAMALRFDLHHRFVQHLPEGLVSRLRNIRSSWYDRKLRSPREAL